MPHVLCPTGLVTSRNHAAVKAVRRLQSRGERDRTGQFFIEGIRFVAQAVEHRAGLQALVVAPELLTNPFGQKLARRLRRSGVPSFTVTGDVFQSLTLSEEPQGLAAVARQEWTSLELAPPAEGLCWVALGGVRSHGNLGTLLRTCDAVGAAGVILLDPAADPYDPATVRASMGALFSQRLVRGTLAQLSAWTRRSGLQVVGTSPSAAVDYLEIDYGLPTVLMLGEERKGLTEEHAAICDTMARIPMVGRSDSLNLAIAGSVMLYAAFNQRRTAGGSKAG